MTSHKRKPIKLPLSEDDIWQDELYGEIARAMAQWLKGSVNIERQIKSLSLAELKGLAASAEARWVQMVLARLADPAAPLTEKERDNYVGLIMG